MAQNPLRLMTIVLIACSVASGYVGLETAMEQHHETCCNKAGRVRSDVLWYADAIDWDKAAKAIDYPVWSDDPVSRLGDERTRNIATKEEYGRKLENAIWWYLTKSPLNAWRAKVDDFSTFAFIAAGLSAALAIWTGLLARRWRVMNQAPAETTAHAPRTP